MTGVVEEGRRKPDTVTALARLSESSNSCSPKEKRGRVCLSREHSLMSVEEATSRRTNREDMDEL